MDSEEAGDTIPPSPYSVSCFLRDGKLVCERKLTGGKGNDASPAAAPAEDPQRTSELSRKAGSFRRDSAAARALQTRQQGRSPAAAQTDAGELRYPSSTAGFSLEGAASPPPDQGYQWNGANAAAAAGRHGPRPSSAVAFSNVPRVSSLMYEG